MKQKKWATYTLVACLATYPIFSTFAQATQAKVKNMPIHTKKEVKNNKIHVKSFLQLRQILLGNDGSDKYIVLDNDLQVQDNGGDQNDIDINQAGKITIDGNHHAINLMFSSLNHDNDIELKGDNKHVIFKNISLNNADGFGAIWGDGQSTVELNNVTSNGQKFIRGNRLNVIVKGKIQADTTYQTFELSNGSLSLQPSADIKATSQKSAVVYTKTFHMAEKTHFKATNSIGENTNMATFVLTNQGQASFSKGSNFDFGNGNLGSKALALGGTDEKCTFRFEKTSIGTWDKGQTQNKKPTYLYNSTETTFTLNGCGQATKSTVQSNSVDFQQRFSGQHGGQVPGTADQTGRFATGDFVKTHKISFTGVDNKTIHVGEKFDPRAGVKAKDSIDGDLTKKIKINGSVNTEQAGRYELTYSVTNSAGQIESKKRYITVEENDSQGTINPEVYTVGQNQITGTYTGDITEARVFIDGQPEEWGGKFENGKFIYPISKNKIHKNSQVYIEGYNKDRVRLDRKSVPIEEKNFQGRIASAVYTLEDNHVTGTYTGDIMLGRLIIDGKEEKFGGEFKNGKFSYYISSGRIKEGSRVYIEGYNIENGLQKLDKKEVQIKRKETSGHLVPDDYTLGDKHITGTYTGDIVRARLTVDGKDQPWGGEFKNGKFSYYINSNKIKEDSKVVIKGYDSNNHELDRQTIKVKNNLQGKILSASYTLGDKVIKGTFSGDINIAKVYINGNCVGWGGSFEGGTFSFYVGKDRILSLNDNVSIEGYHAHPESKLDKKLVRIIK